MEIKGLDISKYQAGINMTAVKNAGMKYVILRGGYTGYGDAKSKAKDSYFETFYKQAKANGLGVGVYYFSIATSYQKGVDEANWLYNNCLKGKQFEYPIYLDVEDDTGGKRWLRNAGKNATTQGIIGFCKTLEAKGYYVGIYASDLSGFKDMMNINELTNYDKWVARYGSKPQYVKDYGMWQYTSSGKIAGYNGNLDVNIAYKDYPSIIKKAGLNGYAKNTVTSKPVTTKPTKKSIDVIVKEILDGKWGTGKTRENLLSKAGYNFKEVQNKVNEKLGIKSPKKTITYIVKSGDTLISIANKHKVNYQKIAKDNKISNPNKIYVGQKLTINK